MINIWKKCNGPSHIGLLSEKAWRIVETQEVCATRKLVDSIQEQIILENLIETNKPLLPQEYLSYHPLLSAPFRYPPLKYGSRFGKKTEPSLWYGSLLIETVMAEKAFYKFHFLRASEAKYKAVEESVTIFSAKVRSDKSIKLSHAPFNRYRSEISPPSSYSSSQLLGSLMREANVQAFIFQSARDKENGMNIGLFSPKAFLHKKPDVNSFQSWQCIAEGNLIEFVRLSSMSPENKSYNVKQFMEKNALPFPAD